MCPMLDPPVVWQNLFLTCYDGAPWQNGGDDPMWSRQSKSKRASKQCSIPRPLFVLISSESYELHYDPLLMDVVFLKHTATNKPVALLATMYLCTGTL